MSFEEKTLAEGEEQNRLEANAADLKLRALPSVEKEIETITHHASIFGWSPDDRRRLDELQDEIKRREEEKKY